MLHLLTDPRVVGVVVAALIVGDAVVVTALIIARALLAISVELKEQNRLAGQRNTIFAERTTGSQEWQGPREDQPHDYLPPAELGPEDWHPQYSAFRIKEVEAAEAAGLDPASPEGSQFILQARIAMDTGTLPRVQVPPPGRARNEPRRSGFDSGS